MGCVVNGPGEAREADLGIAAGRQRGPPVRQGPGTSPSCPRTRWSRPSSSGPSSSTSDGVEAALARADARRRPPRPRPTGPPLLDEQGADANHAGERVDIIRKLEKH